jgi:hypothetical protein
MRRVPSLLVVLPCVLLFAGSGVAQTPPAKQPAPKHPIEETKTFSTNNSKIKKRERRVIKSAAAWKAAWQEMYGNRWPTPELPPVNFKRHMVVLASMGQFGSTGFSIGVRKVVQHERGLDVTVVESRPGFGCLLGQMMTYPATVAIVPRTPGKVRFIEVEERALSCH